MEILGKRTHKPHYVAKFGVWYLKFRPQGGCFSFSKEGLETFGLTKGLTRFHFLLLDKAETPAQVLPEGYAYDKVLALVYGPALDPENRTYVVPDKKFPPIFSKKLLEDIAAVYKIETYKSAGQIRLKTFTFVASKFDSEFVIGKDDVNVPITRKLIYLILAGQYDSQPNPHAAKQGN